MRRRSDSLSSAATTSALISQDRATARMTACASNLSRSGMEVSKNANKASSAMMPYLITSARPAIHSRRGRVWSMNGAMIDARFPSDAGIHLRHQRRGNLHIRDASLVDRGGEPREVADDAAAQRQEHRTAFEPMCGQGI